jgi:hypothetical protein
MAHKVSVIADGDERKVGQRYWPTIDSRRGLVGQQRSLEWRPYRNLGLIALLSLLTLVGATCGRVDSTSGAASAARSPSPPMTQSPTPTSVPDEFQPGDCTYPPIGGTPTQPAPDTFQTELTIPAGWTLQDPSRFLITGPATYAFQPTTISVSAPLPTDPGQTPSSSLARMVQGVVSVTSGPQTCTVGGDSAAYLSFTNGTSVGNMVLWFHFGDAYLLQVTGTGGVDPKAIQDAKGVLASVTYAHNVPPPGYTPGPTSKLPEFERV